MHARRLLLLAGVAGLLLLLGATLAADRSGSVVVRDADGEVIFRSPLPDSGDFEIEYIHSYYDAPAREHFVAGEDGNFELVEISSPSEAVLDYYELEGRKEEVAGGLLRLVPDEPQEFETLPLIGTQRGRRTLIVSDEPFPLYYESGPRHITIRVEEDTLLTRLRRLPTG